MARLEKAARASAQLELANLRELAASYQALFKRPTKNRELKTRMRELQRMLAAK